jgi:hypothetical protein
VTATRVSWLRAVWAVIGGSIFAFVATFLSLMLPLYLVGLPIPIVEGTNGRGWPWRIEGPWSLVADIGPLLFSGAAFAYGAEGFTNKRTGMVTRRAPIAFTAAVLGWVTVGNVSDAGLLGVSGLAAFVAMVVVTREMSAQPNRPWRWTPVKARFAVVVVLALILATLSYGFLHPLSADQTELESLRDGRARISVFLGNEGRADVTFLSVSVPGVTTRALIDPSDSYEYDPKDPDLGMVPLEGKTFVGNESHRVDLVVSAGCPSSRVDRVLIRLRVLGRTVDQVVRLGPTVPVGCA